MAKENRDYIIALGLGYEGGYVNHPRDPGGATNMGITIATARIHGLDKDGDGDVDFRDVKLLTKEDAIAVYARSYWNKLQCDLLPSGVDAVVYDFGINSGTSRSAKFLQRLVGVTIDGYVGPQTVHATNNYCQVHGSARVINDLCDARQEFLEGLSTFKTFGRGWTKRVKHIRQEALQLVVKHEQDQVVFDFGKEENVKSLAWTIAQAIRSWRAAQ